MTRRTSRRAETFAFFARAFYFDHVHRPDHSFRNLEVQHFAQHCSSAVYENQHDRKISALSNGSFVRYAEVRRPFELCRIKCFFRTIVLTREVVMSYLLTCIREPSETGRGLQMVSGRFFFFSPQVFRAMGLVPV